MTIHDQSQSVAAAQRADNKGLSSGPYPIYEINTIIPVRAVLTQRYSGSIRYFKPI